MQISQIKGIGNDMILNLHNFGIWNLNDLNHRNPNELLKIKGMGTIKIKKLYKMAGIKINDSDFKDEKISKPKISKPKIKINKSSKELFYKNGIPQVNGKLFNLTERFNEERLKLGSNEKFTKEKEKRIIWEKSDFDSNMEIAKRYKTKGATPHYYKYKNRAKSNAYKLKILKLEKETKMTRDQHLALIVEYNYSIPQNLTQEEWEKSASKLYKKINKTQRGRI